MEYNIHDHNLQIVDSYKISKKNFLKILNEIKEKEPNYLVWNRNIKHMCLEWATHNALYALSIKRAQTGSCDLNYPQSFLEKTAYTIIGCLVWLFIE